ncbi:DUF493 domain-containing protein [Fulvivirga maritima]|uniref:DUF493 family protein n=1 Tax=Fulvivirga maritima TaxID=2904247 RepID=UPI001F167976|nr:DUF493 family protein [Fulvivirga maritima]UII28669.1 DUF493 domain-containing protein [Fulvivirga maritima]
MQEGTIELFKDKLDKEYEFPALYIFKFIAPKGKEAELKGLFTKHEIKEKASSNGNYISITVEMMMPSSDSIIEYYIKANQIEGIIAL